MTEKRTAPAGDSRGDNGPPRAPTGGGTPAGRALTIVTFAALAALVAGLLLRAWANAAYPFALEDAESVVLGASWRAAQGKTFYSEGHDAPYVITVYNPLLPAVAGGAMRVFGDSPAVVRGVTLFFYFGAAAVICLFVRSITGMKRAALAAAAFFLLERHLFARAGHAAVDYPAIFFSLLGLYLWKDEGWRRAAALVAFALAFFSKQSALAAPAAAFAWMFFGGKRRQALKMSALFAAAVGLGLAACWALFGKAYFIDAFYYVRGGAYLPFKAVRQVAVAAALYVAPTAGLALLAWRGARTRQMPLVAWYGILGLAAALGIGMQGAGYGYFFDFAAALAIVAGLMWAAVVQRAKKKGLEAAVILAVALQAALVVVGVWPELKALGEMRLSALADRGGGAAIRDGVVREAYETNDGYVLCRETAMEIGARAKSVGTDLYKVTQLVRDERLPADTMTRLVRGPKPFSSLVIMPERDAGWKLFSDEMLREIDANYELDHESKGLKFYRPKARGTD